MLWLNTYIKILSKCTATQRLIDYNVLRLGKRRHHPNRGALFTLDLLYMPISSESLK